MAIKKTKKKLEKKVVFFIVEGATDKNALGRVFTKLYKNKQVKFHFTSGDITSDLNNTSKDAELLIENAVRAYIADKKLKKNDIWEIVQIFDMDGAYIAEDDILEQGDKKFKYTDEGIMTNDKPMVIQRNIHKVELMDFLVSKGEIYGIPYTGYYFSSHLDHALYGVRDLTSDQKVEFSHAFAEEFNGKERSFIDFLSTVVSNGCPDEYKASWDFIKVGLNSLDRHTNLHVYFLKNPDYDLLV